MRIDFQNITNFPNFEEKQPGKSWGQLMCPLIESYRREPFASFQLQAFHRAKIEKSSFLAQLVIEKY